MKKYFILLMMLSFYAALFGQNKSVLKLEDIMKGQEFVGYWPEDVHWSYDSKLIYFRWNPEEELVSKWYAYSLENNTYKVLSADDLARKLPEQATYNPDKTALVYARGGDIYTFDIQKSAEKQLFATLAYESNPAFSADGQKIIYTLDNNLFSWHLADNKIEQLTNFQQKKETQAFAPVSEQEKWLLEDRKNMFDFFSYEDELAKARRANAPIPASKSMALVMLDGESVMGQQLSPDERFISFVLMKSPQTKSTEVPNYVTKSGYTENENSRPKVGSLESTFEFKIFDRKENKVYALNTPLIDGITQWPEPYKAIAHGERHLVFGELKYADDGKNAVLIARSQDNKDIWFMLLDLQTGNPTVIHRQTDEAWIGGPGIGTYWPNSNFGWMPDNEHVYLQSEQSGYSHLYIVNIKTKKVKALTKGNFEVHEAYLSADKSKWYLLTNEVHPGERHFYSMPLNGGLMTRMSTEEGYHEVHLSPDEKNMAVLYSNATSPWEVYIRENQENAPIKFITFSQTDEYKSYPWRKPEVLTITASDGKKVYARLFTPADSLKNMAAVIFVHGAGYLQNAHKYWSNYYRETMFHNLLADNGYTILDIDYRGSEGYGRDWRTGIYRHMGGKDLSDHVDAANWLVKSQGIDAGKIGIYGGSYGGFITLMALFKNPGVFKCGAALRSVTNWSNYNHGYTANILNTPLSDPEAYRQSSPIYFAGGLSDRLLILHGMIDDNVHFQDVVDLNQRLIELGKINWDMAVYPLERHGFRHASSWTDEYRRIFELFEQELNK